MTVIVRGLPFTEITKDHDGNSQRTAMFRQVKGAGDYLGAHITMDFTINGAIGFVQHLGPFNFPVGIEATYKQALKKAKAKLHCDFTTGYSVKGRADVRDGLIIYDNDLTNKIKAHDNNTGGCNLEIIEGDTSSAHFDAIRELEKHFNSLYISRTTLSKAEKQKYYDGVIADINNNRRSGSDSYESVFTKYRWNGWQYEAVSIVKKAADFHWHTNIQDVENLSKINFSKTITVAGDASIKKEIPVQICLIYNNKTKAYDRCGATEENNSQTMMQAMEQAAQSAPCQGVSDPFQCGKNRDESGLTDREEQPPWVRDSHMTNNI